MKKRESLKMREARRNRYIASSLKNKRVTERDEVVMHVAGELFDIMNPLPEED